ncbi:transmembrane sensor [Bordetella ansorpii]|uniref:Transmembrane sensor n=1 Tax=Bordetella ansorpii TaxID=288768 RepID=A0A157S5X8_9BORD|nr:FecR domain-containing protein [Bordetella ansorpii]SAI65812.1 transmembrane sensor [Bordetella ansorpii]
MTADRPESYAALQQQASEWWVRLRSDRLTRAQAEAFRQWCASSPEHARAWREIVAVWQGLQPVMNEAARRDPGLAHPPAGSRGPAWRPGRRAFIGAALAAPACAVMAVHPPLALWPAVTEWAADYRTGTGEQRQVMLASQATVQMNTQTRFNLREDGAGGGIELLAGEVEIQVAPGLRRAFPVLAGDGRIDAQAALFNVRYTGPEVCVTCLQGELALQRGPERRILRPGMQSAYDERGIRGIHAVDPADVTAWRTGSLSFAGRPLSEVIDEINRYRRGRVVLRNARLGRQLVRMRFSIRQTDLALEMLRDLYGAQLTELPGGIVLMS